MKKILVSTLCVLLILSLAACGTSGTPGGINISEEDELAGTSDTYGTIDVTAERSSYNMLTGLSDLADDRIGLRPYCVSVNNIAASWPQKGISAADIIIEMETEGGITRLMCLYSDTREVALIGSERSLRDQFIEAIYPVDPIIVHIGTSIFADKALADNNLRSLDGNNMPGAIWVDRVRMQTYSSEHCKFTSGELIYNTLQEKGFNEESSSTLDSYFNFAAPEETIVPETGTASSVNFVFSSNGYDGDFRYDADLGKYLKFQRNQPHMDAGEDAAGNAINQQLAFDNVFVLFANITNRVGHEELVEVDYQAGGKGYYFSNGSYEEITWTKGDYSNPFVFTKADGSELVVNTGQSIMCFTRVGNLDTLSIQP
jgi:hypothetical protein